MGSSNPALAEDRRFWASVGEAIAGSQQDFTQGSLGRAIVLLSIPMVLEMSMESLFAVVDVFWVARISSDAVTTVGLTESLLTLVYAVAMGLGMSATAFVARRIGEKDPEDAAIGAVQAILLAIVISVIVGIAGGLTAPALLRVMGASPEVLSGVGYTQVMLGGIATVVLLIVINSVFRGTGDAPVAMRALWLGNGLNIILDPCLIFGYGPFPALGVTGAAVATNIGRGTAVIYLFYVLFFGRARIRIRAAHLRLAVEPMKRLLQTASTGMLQFLIATASWVVLMRTMALFGGAAVAGYTIAIRIIVFSILPSWGMCNAAATLVGQNLGAKRPDRAERAVWMTGLYNMVFLGCVGLLFILVPGFFVTLFTSDDAVVPHAVDCLRFVGYGYMAYAYGMVMVQAFNGAGDTVTPTIINFFCYWVLQIPLAWTLAVRAGMGPRGVFLAITIAESLLALVAILAFRRGRWKTQKI